MTDEDNLLAVLEVCKWVLIETFLPEERRWDKKMAMNFQLTNIWQKKALIKAPEKAQIPLSTNVYSLIFTIQNKSFTIFFSEVHDLILRNKSVKRIIKHENSRGTLSYVSRDIWMFQNTAIVLKRNVIA